MTNPSFRTRYSYPVEVTRSRITRERVSRAMWADIDATLAATPGVVPFGAVLGMHVAMQVADSFPIYSIDGPANWG